MKTVMFEKDNIIKDVRNLFGQKKKPTQLKM